MITYVDTSTLIKLIVEEAGSERAELIWRTADSVASVSLVVVEAHAALAAAARDKRLSSKQLGVAQEELAQLVAGIHLVDVTAELIESAAELAQSESLWGYDVVHLAGAVFVEAAILTSADNDLCAAARRQGMHEANPSRHDPSLAGPTGERPCQRRDPGVELMRYGAVGRAPR